MKRKYEIAVVCKGAFSRTVRIYSPKKADRAVIMHDGQNVFYDEDATFKMSWRAIDALRLLGIKNTAVIGVDSLKSPAREYDYLPYKTEVEIDGQTFGGGAAEYIEYIRDMLIPYLQKRFSYKFYAMLGSSAGASATLAYAAENDARVRAYGMFSTPLFLCEKAYDGFFKTFKPNPDDSYYVFCGGNEGLDPQPDITRQKFTEDAYALTDNLRRLGVKNLKLRLNNTAEHNEIAWRLPEREFFRDFSMLD